MNFGSAASWRRCIDVEFLDLENLTKSEDKPRKKKLSKKQWFLIACVGVGVIGLLVWYRKQNSGGTQIAKIATGYEGYPTMSEGMDMDYLTEAVGSNLYQSLGNVITAQDSYYQKLFDEITSGMGVMTERLDKFDEENSTYQKNNGIVIGGAGAQTYVMDTLEQMQKNSEAWFSSSPEQRILLENQNQFLGSTLGASYSDGRWYTSGGNLLYSTAPSGRAMLDETEILNQMKANSSAWHGASEAERLALEQKNKELGSRIGASYNEGSGEWFTTSGERLYQPVYHNTVNRAPEPEPKPPVSAYETTNKNKTYVTTTGQTVTNPVGSSWKYRL